MDERRYIRVILPLKLDWEPCYWTDDAGLTAGMRVSVLFAGRRYVGVVSAVDVAPETEISRIRQAGERVARLPDVSEREIAFWRCVAEYYLCSVGEVYKAAYPTFKIEQEETGARNRERLEARLAAYQEKMQRARKEETRVRYKAVIDRIEQELHPERSAMTAAEAPSLTPAQQTVYQAIKKAFPKTTLLEGVTGSGKTEVYLKLARETLEAGRSVLYLVPEIALSRQLEERIRSVFPDVLLFHSAVSPVRKREIAAILRKGRPAIVLGTRSALFLPHHDLGLIVVDEEHDTSYKQDAPAPRYNGRDTAIMLAGIHGAQVVLGSATPSLESLYNAENGRFAHVVLKERFYHGEQPEVRVIDTVAERKKRGMVGHLSRKLLFEIDRVLKEGGQAVVLRARRYYAPSLQCEECGTLVKCPHCNVPLSYHLDGRMVCHHCGYTAPYTGVCAHCGGALQQLGAGTQRIEEELAAVFPDARVARLDSDTPDADESRIIHAFAAGGIDILVGTQIVTKGFDFSGLSLVAVIQADSLLGQQDFRADERAWQLLEQFRGRSGRRGKQGLLLIQTREPDHPVLARLQDGGDAPTLLAERRLFFYPPYSRLVKVIVRDANEKRLEALSRALAGELATVAPNVTGPYAPVVDRLAGESIRHIRLLLPRDRALTATKKRIAALLAGFEKDRKYPGHIVIDVDPV